MRKRLIIGVSGEIGSSLAKKWLQTGDPIVGTYRKRNKRVKELAGLGVETIQLDLSHGKDSINKFVLKHEILLKGWTQLIISVGDLEPVCTFQNCNFKEWERAISTNFLKPLHVVHELLPLRKLKSISAPMVVFFSGGAINKANKYYSAYSVSKVGLIKMTELLQYEIPSVKFVAIGPGWIKSDIHKATLGSKNITDQTRLDTIARFESNLFESIDRIQCVLEKIDFLETNLIGGRNISVPNDPWDSDSFNKILKQNSELFKLRRYEK